jgi:hypothetical protein
MMFSGSTLRTGNFEDRDSSLRFEINKSDDNISNIKWNLLSLHGKDSTASPSSLNLISSGRLFVVTGRSKYYHNGVLIKEIPFKISLQNATTVTTTEITDDEGSVTKKKGDKKIASNDNNQEFKNVLRGCKSFALKASGFSDECPISALSLIFTIGDYETEHVGFRSVLLIKGTIEMIERQSYEPGHAVKSTGDTCDHVADRIILLTAQVGIPESPKYGDTVDGNSNGKVKSVKKNDKRTENKLDNILQIVQNVSILMVLAAIVINPTAFERGVKMGLKWALKVPSQIPSGLPGDAPQSNKYRNITLPYADTVIFSYILKSIQIFLSVFLFLLFILTPFRRDFLEVSPIYFRKYVLENLLGIYNTPNSLTFFVHGWNAWGFCGAIRKGRRNIINYVVLFMCMLRW